MQEELKGRMIRHFRFLENELEDYDGFRALTWAAYNTDRKARRDVERWVENILNSTIDIARLVIRAEEKAVPGTCREMVSLLGLVPGFKQEQLTELSQWVSLRNVLSHEYLDVKWNSIKRFIAEAEPLYRDFLQQVRDYIARNLGPG